MASRRNRVLGLFEMGPAATAPAPAADALSVTEVINRATAAVRRQVGRVRLCAEVSSFRGGGRTWYFSLKDRDDGQNNVLAAVMFASKNARVQFDIGDGVEVIATGTVSVYGPHSKLQLIVDTLEHSGTGRLAQKYEEMRQRFEAEGLFDDERKRPLPMIPRCVGVVTSRDGAAIHDIIKVLRARHSGAHILLSATRVQGQGASQDIAAALRRLDESGRCDVIIIGRGGGAYEDLWSFNMEVVVRAIAACQTPVIASVGHQSDVTLADFVADARAATPSHAAELCTAHQGALRERLAGLRRRADVAVRRAMDYEVDRHQALYDALIAATDQRLQREAATLRQLNARLISPERQLALRQRALEHCHRRLLACSPRPALLEAGAQLRVAQAAITRGALAARDRSEKELALLARRLSDLSPLAVLDRGYALVTSERGVVQSVRDVSVGETLKVRMADGVVQVEAKAVTEASDDGAR